MPSTSPVQPRQQQQSALSNMSTAWHVPEAKAEASSNPRLDPAADTPKPSAKQTAQAERERERAEKLKEKNKRAQRKFRQRQKVLLLYLKTHSQNQSEPKGVTSTLIAFSTYKAPLKYHIYTARQQS